MSTSDVLLDAPGKKVVLMGNEAIARGLLEGGLKVAASYPGTPSSEILRTLITIGGTYDIYTEWSVNEKVAAEVAISASLAGLRSMVSMKGVGVNVASEPFQAFTYMGARGGIVLVCADDVGCHSSHTEQDNRFFAREAYLPIFEPFDPREAKEMAQLVLKYSEEWAQPVMLRITTRIAHTSADITLGEIPKEKRKGDFNRLPNRWVNLPKNARRMRKELILRMKNIAEAQNTLSFNRIEGNEDAEYGIIASGISYGYVKEALDLLGVSQNVKLLKIGTPYPLPDALVEKVLTGSKKVLVVEELEPFVEMQVRALANKQGILISITGKELIPLDGELSVHMVKKAVSKFMELPTPKEPNEFEKFENTASQIIPPRPPVLCPGCGHRSVFYAIKLAERKYKRGDKESKGFIKPSDIGCYTLGFQSPLEAVDVNFCMGASIGISSGFSKVIHDPVVCTIGDSTFFHAGIPPLLNAVFNRSDITVIILDNRTTAMTGFQPHPGVGITASGEETKMISIEEIVKACGVELVKSVDAYDLEELVSEIDEAVKHKGPAVIITHRLCRMLELRELRGKETISHMSIDYELCKDCRICVDRFGCPAMYIIDEKVAIDPNLCNGCGVCTQKQVCPKGAIIFCEAK
ncbi:MAG: indolepyruvate ferredoxin oxidoreductase subunit alpha [Methanomassiliicoccales archaeon]|nr:MAG: indolepyruvate ferredoxin oxidoreductase subunit alpha [Methanomassiliicoccales archaeon]